MKKTTRLVALITCVVMFVVACALLVACTTICEDGKHVDSNHDGVCDVCGTKDLAVTHQWSATTGKCTVCGLQCAHEHWTEGTCDVCKMVCAHEAWTTGAEKSTCNVCGLECAHEHWTNGICDLCKYGCTHTWDSELGVCTICSIKCAHKFDTEGTCEICGLNDPNYSDDHYPHTFVDGVCSEPSCGWECVHKDHIKYFDESVCTLCGWECEDHNWEAVGGTCTICGVTHKHKSSDFTTKTEDSAVCGVCGWTCEHSYNASGLCVTCGYVCLNHVWGDNGKCEKCGAEKPVYWVNDTKNYTYRMGPSQLPTSWNYHTYQENMSTYILDYTSDTLYTMDYNEDYTGFKIVPSMASGDPIDVSAQYAGQFGIQAGETGKAYKIPLKTTLKFDDGTAINANTFVRSMQNLLNPTAKNYRADNMWKSGSVKIYGSEAYAKQGSTTYADATKGAGVGWEKEWASLTEEDQKVLFFSAEDCSAAATLLDYGYWGSSDAPYSSAAQCLANICRDEEAGILLTTPLVQALQGKSLYEIMQDETMAQTFNWLLEGWCTEEEEEFSLLCTQVTWASYDYKDVGFFAASDYELVIVLINAMEDNFYLRYELCTSYFLVNNALYEQNISTTGGVYSNSYGTSVATYSGYGPYKLAEYLADSKIRLVRNEYWHGYYESEHSQDQYMTTAIEYNVVTEDSIRLEKFLKGELDGYSLLAEDMDDYITSKYTYFNDSESTWFIAMNPSVAHYEEQQALANPVTTGNTVVKTPMAIDEFRQALSYSLDRTAYILACNPTSGVGKSLMSVMQYYDPENGLSYRSTDEAKDAILEFWGLADAWGPDKEYETRDEAIESITGYDPAGAKALFTTAYNKAVELGYITQAMIDSKKWEVQVMIGSSSWSSTYYTKSFDFFNANWTKAVEGTPFEGHLTFVKSGALGSSYPDQLRAGNCDLLFGVGFGGSMFDPFSFMDVFTSELQYDPDTDKTLINMDVEIDGKVLRASLYDWVSECLQGNEIVAKVVGTDGNVTTETVTISAGPSADVSLRLKIMAKAETAIMNLSNMIPLMTDSSASLRCMRIVYKTEDYILGAGRGGVRYYTYTHSDEEFAAFVAAQGGTLNYAVTE